MNNLVKNFPFIYLCDGRMEYDNFIYLFYDKKEKLNVMSSEEQIFESIFGFVPKEFLNNYTTSFMANVLFNSERFELVKQYPIYGHFDFDMEREAVMKRLPNDIIKYYVDIIHNRETKKMTQDSKDIKIDKLEKEINEVKEEFFKFKCKSKYELSGWKGFCEFIKQMNFI